jgi:hypothetical protein
MEKQPKPPTPTASTGGIRKGSGASALVSPDIIDQLLADQDPEYRKSFVNRKYIRRMKLLYIEHTRKHIRW